MSDIIELGCDPAEKLSSNPAIKSGHNRGWRLPESGGRWVSICGYACGALADVRSAAEEAPRKLALLGHRIGSLSSDGCVDFFIWVQS